MYFSWKIHFVKCPSPPISSFRTWAMYGTLRVLCADIVSHVCYHTDLTRTFWNYQGCRMKASFPTENSLFTLKIARPQQLRLIVCGQTFIFLLERVTYVN